MANSTIAEELTCPICLEFYKDPRLLPCHHSLCKSCLVALCSKKQNNSECELQCPSCRHIFQAMDETHIESLPKNFTLASIVCKFQDSVKGDIIIPCDLCEEGQNGRAIKKCLQCQFNYCRMCLEQLHPKRGAMANHKLIHIMEAFGEEHEKIDTRSACLSSASDDQYVVSQKYDHLKRAKYCLSCDEVCAEEDQPSLEGNHGDHDTTEIKSAFRRRKEEFECILSRFMDEDLEIAKGLADLSSLIETNKKMFEEKRVELVQRFEEVAGEVEKRKLSAENRIEEEMNMRLTSLQSRLSKLEDLKAKTHKKIAAFSELSSLTDEDSSIFLIKLKKLRNEIGPVTGNYIQQATIGIEGDPLLPIEQLMNDIIANAIRDICPSERSLKIHDPDSAQMDIAETNAIMGIKVTSVQTEGTMSADVEWVATRQVDHYEISYFCDLGETVLRGNIGENKCRLTSLKWDSEYTVSVTAYLPDGKTSLDSTIFKTDPKVKDISPSISDTSPKHMYMAIQVTNNQTGGKMSADVKWVATEKAAQYEVSYSCNPDETVVLKKIAGQRCRLINLRWSSTYTVKVTTQLQDGRAVFDEHIFNTDPEVICFPMVAAEVCNKKISVRDSFHDFEASDRTNNWVSYRKVGEFSGIVFAPVLQEAMRFWTMNLELSIFEKGMINQTFLDFGIINYTDLDGYFGLTNNTKAYSCSIFRKTERKVHIRFQSPSNVNEYSCALPLKLHQKKHLCFGFLYDQVAGQLAVMDCEDQDVLHIFREVSFCNDFPLIFAICPYHTEVKMRVDIDLNYEHSSNENISSWMRKISTF